MEYLIGFLILVVVGSSASLWNAFINFREEVRKTLMNHRDENKSFRVNLTEDQSQYRKNIDYRFKSTDMRLDLLSYMPIHGKRYKYVYDDELKMMYIIDVNEIGDRLMFNLPLVNVVFKTASTTLTNDMIPFVTNGRSIIKSSMDISNYEYIDDVDNPVIKMVISYSVESANMDNPYCRDRTISVEVVYKVNHGRFYFPEVMEFGEV